MKAKPSHLLAITFCVGLISFVTYGQAAPAPLQVAAASTDNDDDEEDEEEEEAVDYRDRVREIQGWMNRRDSERKGDAPSLNVAPVAPPQAFPKYFRDNGYDESGRRRLDGDVRARLRSAPEASYTPHYHRQYSWHKRWHRHVHPYIHARSHHSRHGYHHPHVHQSYSGGSSRRSIGHGSMKGGKHEIRTSRHQGHASSKHEKRQLVKARPTMRAAKSQASPHKAVSKPAKKSRSGR